MKIKYLSIIIFLVSYFVGYSQEENFAPNPDICNEPGGWWYPDSDNDGYGNLMISDEERICGTPPDNGIHYVHNSGDCDDNDSNINPNTIWYADLDLDGYGNANSGIIITCQPIIGSYSLFNTDCNDNAPLINPDTKWYYDNDMDGYGNSLNYIRQCTQPNSRYVLKIDCDDNNSAYTIVRTWAIDLDGDGFGESNPIISCSKPSGGNYVSNYPDESPGVYGPIQGGITPSANSVFSSDKNYILTIFPQKNITNLLQIDSDDDAKIEITYFDGLGRSVQKINHKQSNTGKDIVTHIEYDAFGRMEKEFLPYVNQSASLNSNGNANNDVLNFYNTTTYENTSNPYGQKQFEASPLNRVLKQAAPGEAWKLNSGHEIKLDYQTNITNEVKLYGVSLNSDFTPTLINDSGSVYYNENQLYKIITKNENWTSGNNNTTQEFKNKEGQVVLKRTFADIFNNGSLVESAAKHDTYYVYDQYSNLTYVIPPAVSGSITQTVLDNMCYQYQYDYRNRLVEKKLPGKQREYIVYDKLNRVVATGPAYNPYGGDDTNKGWLITKYDVLNRPVYTAWYDYAVANTDDRKTVQAAYDSNTIHSENKTTSASTIDGISINYTNQVNPTTFVLLTVNYYDTYDYPNAPVVPTTLPNSTFRIATNVKGLPTGSWVRVLDATGSTSNELSYTIYDNKFSPVRSYTKNYLGGYTQVDSKIDWAGKTEYTLTKHKRLTSDTEIVVKDSFEYSAQDRLVKHKHKINSLAEQLLDFNTYDELGQLISKKVGGADITGTTALQKVDYTYNVRGWLKGINDITNLVPTITENDLFAFKLSYDNPENGLPLYNGNISETFWRTDSDNIKRKYTYKYDNLSRLLEANYSKPGSTSTPDNYLERLTYDKNGNIQTLIRNGGNDNDGISAVQKIDNLVYSYDLNNLNLLKKVVDSTTNSQGFSDNFSNVDDYDYDANGNLILDYNKGISSITYNHLNLPTLINFFANASIQYIYNSSGQKIKKIVSDNFGHGSSNTTIEYLNGFQYKNNVLTLFPQAEGYVNYIPPAGRGDGVYKYIFNYTDHLGNVRLSYSLDNNVLKILEENHYYAFGLKHSNYNSEGLVYQVDGNNNVVLTPISPLVGSSYKYKYNGKELQEELGLNMYDYGARNYDPALGRWMNIDPKAETSRRWSPYTYCYNNPMYFVDPDGMQADDWRDKNGKELNQKQLNNVKVYIFYNPKASGEDGGFKEQTMKQYAEYEKQYGKGSVALSDAMTTKDFAKDWGDISGTPNTIGVNHHGNNQTVMLDTNPDGNDKTQDGQYIVSTDNGKSPTSQTPSMKISDLPDTKGDISNATMNLNTCNSNNPSKTPMTAGTTLAKGFSRDTEIGTVRGTNGSVNYNSAGSPTTQWYYGKTWQYFQKGKQVSTPNQPTVSIPRMGGF